MTCHEMEPKIAEFLAGELEERSEVEEHLLACADCRSAFSTARAGWEAATEWKVGVPSGDAVASTLAALEPAAPSRAALRILQAGTLAASLVIAVVIGTSNRGAPIVEVAHPVSAVPASTGLASLRPSVGQLFVQDENGRPAGELAIRRLSVTVDIRDGIARTEIEEIFENRTDRRLEGTFLFPLPPDASISRLAMEIEGKLMEGEVVEREKARRTYEGIVRSMKDPALLEWMPGGLFQCRIFPIEARSEKRIVIAYTQALTVFDGRGQYVYPLAGESARELGIGRFEFTATVRAGVKIASAGSPSHAAATIRLDDRTMRTTFAHSEFRPRADFVLAFETEARGEIQVSAHRPEGADPGYFAAFITPASDPEEDLRRDRKLFFLIDASGSVTRAELEAARAVVRRMVETLRPADRFRIGSHNLFVASMVDDVAPDAEGKRVAERFLAGIAPAGAGDFAGSLEFILASVPDNGEIVYVGEGTPTWGEKDPAKIVARVREAIGTRRISIRTVAVGSDSERGLLETVAREFNGGAHAINPSDDVHARAGEIARTLGRSAMSAVKIEFKGAVTDAAPANPGSIHFGERLLVTGRYGAGPVTLVLTARVHDRTIQREFPLVLPEREAAHPHVKRLWAQRRLADLVAQGEAKKADAIKLSVEHQVMTPYTSFLVLENEKAYREHEIERTKKDADQKKDPRNLAVNAEEARKRQVLAALARLLTQAYQAFDERKFDKCLGLCNSMIDIDPRYTVAVELREDVQKVRQREEHYGFLRSKVENWKKLTGRDDEAVIPYADTVVFPTAEMWAEISKKATSIGALSGAQGGKVERAGVSRGDDGSRSARELWMDVIRRQQPGEGTGGGERDWESEAEARYNLAIRYYDAGDFEGAERECQQALMLNPKHGASHALMLEVQFALGKGRVTPQNLEFESIIQMAAARQQQVHFEVREAMDNGLRLYNLGNYDAAERHFRTIIEYAKWLPEGKDLNAFRKEASQQLERVRIARDEPKPAETPVRKAQAASTNPGIHELLDPAFYRPSRGRRPAVGPLPFDGEALANQIMLMVDRSAWDESQGRNCVFQNGLLVVRNTPEVQRKVQTYLDNLRRSLGADLQPPEPESSPAPTGVHLEIYNVQDITYGLQDFPGVNIVLSEDALGRTGTMGKLVQEGDGSRISGVLSLDDINPAFSTVPGQQFATFIDPDGGGGPLAVSSPGITGTFGNEPRNVPFLGDLPMIDLLFKESRASAAADPIVTGVNRSVTLPNDELSFQRSMSDFEARAYAEAELRDQMDRPIDSPQEGGLPRMLRNAPADLRVDSYYAYRGPATSGPPSNNQRLTATQDLQYQRQELDRLSRDPRAPQADIQAAARRVSDLEKVVAQQSTEGMRTESLLPRMVPAGSVSAVALEEGIVVLSIGRDAGVNEGAEFTILRGGKFVCKIVIDRVDRSWSSGRVVIKGDLEAKVGDEAVAPPPPPTLQVAFVSDGTATLSGSDARGLAVGSVVVLSRQGNFVAALTVSEVTGTTAKARVAPGFRSTAIEPGDLGIRIGTFAELWSVLPQSIRLDIVSARALAGARHKLRVLRFAGGGR